MQQPSSFVSHLKQTLEDIEAQMMKLLDASRIKRFENDPYSQILIVAPEYYWDTPSAQEQRLQMILQQTYVAWFERFELLFEHAATETRRCIAETNSFVMKWINKGES